MGIIWGSIQAYFLKQGHFSGIIFMAGNRTIFRAFFGRGQERILVTLTIKTRVFLKQKTCTSLDFSKNIR